MCTTKEYVVECIELRHASKALILIISKLYLFIVNNATKYQQKRYGCHRTFGDIGDAFWHFQHAFEHCRNYAKGREWFGITNYDMTWSMVYRRIESAGCSETHFKQLTGKRSFYFRFSLYLIGMIGETVLVHDSTMCL